MMRSSAFETVSSVAMVTTSILAIVDNIVWVWHRRRGDRCGRLCRPIVVRSPGRRTPNIVDVLTDAEPADKAELYNELGITLKYTPMESVAIKAHPCGVNVRIGGGSYLNPTRFHRRRVRYRCVTSLMMCRTTPRTAPVIYLRDYSPATPWLTSIWITRTPRVSACSTFTATEHGAPVDISCVAVKLFVAIVRRQLCTAH